MSAEPNKGRWTSLGRPEEFHFAPGAAVHAGGRWLAVFPVEQATGECAFAAIDNACPHASAPLCEGTLLDGKIVCPLHLWEFDLQTGACDVGPDWNVKTYPTRLVDGRIEALLPD